MTFTLALIAMILRGNIVVYKLPDPTNKSESAFETNTAHVVVQRTTLPFLQTIPLRGMPKQWSTVAVTGECSGLCALTISFYYQNIKSIVLRSYNEVMLHKHDEWPITLRGTRD